MKKQKWVCSEKKTKRKPPKHDDGDDNDIINDELYDGEYNDDDDIINDYSSIATTIGKESTIIIINLTVPSQ